jgi:SAM-dependent methyltransferase
VIADAAVELLELRKRARGKFVDADRMFFTPEGLEQATGDSIAAYRASRFPEGAALLDACCGIGGDARFFAEMGRVVAVDSDPISCACAGLNCAIVPVRAAGLATVATVCADVTGLPLSRLADRGISAAFFDPSRRADDRFGGRRRVSGAENYSPPLEWAEALRDHFPSVAVKVSPAIDDASLARYRNCRIEFISSEGQCKEAVIWSGQAAGHLQLEHSASPPYFATVLRAGRPPATLAPSRSPEIETAPIREFLYEPDPAVIRAHLIPQVAELHSAAWIEPGVAYLASDRSVPTPFAAAFRVVDHLPYDRKAVQRKLRDLGAHLYSVKKRGVDLDPIQVQKGLEPCGDLPLDLVLMRRSGRVIAILCQRMDTPAQ